MRRKRWRWQAADGLEANPSWSRAGDGGFSVSFGGIGWDAGFSPDGARRYAEALANRWREANAADTVGIAVVCIHVTRKSWLIEAGGRVLDEASSQERAEAKAREALAAMTAQRPAAPRR